MGKSLDQQMHAACAALRFHEALRRRWAEARAEAAVQEASAHMRSLDRPVPASWIREAALVPHSSEVEHGEREAQALGVWRAHWEILQGLEPLNAPRSQLPQRLPAVPVPQLVASANRNVLSFSVARGDLDPRAVGKPKDSAALGQIMALSRTRGAGSFDAVAEIWALFHTRAVFEDGSAETGNAVVKALLARLGVEPTGVAILSGTPFDLPASGGGAGEALRRAVIAGCEKGTTLALHVQAGISPETL